MSKIVRFVTTRSEGHTRTPQALKNVLRSRHWPLNVATAEQVHQPLIDNVPFLQSPKTYKGADGLVTRVPQQPLVIFTADCVPIFLWSKRKPLVALLHGGWRGVRGKIVEKGVRLAKAISKIAPADLWLALGPAIGPCCFEVQWDVARYFPRSRTRHKDRWLVDLPCEIGRQARALGIPKNQISLQSTCTFHTRRYFSFRRDQTADRIASGIVIL